MSDYSTFLESKRTIAQPAGIEVPSDAIHPMLFPFQRVLVQWALRKGRAAIFADTGLGKSFMQVEFARLTGKRALILAPLSVVRQTASEARKIGVEVHYTRSGSDLIEGINITNYEMLAHFDPADFGTIVLDESSILKSLDGETRNKLIELFASTPYRLCCTATPAPNDITEIANHAEFLGILSRTEMLSMFFVHDSGLGSSNGWRLKGHAQEAFYRWMASWSMSVKKPSNIGEFDDSNYTLPPLHTQPVIVGTSYAPEDQLFFTGLKGITDRSRARKGTIEERVQCAVDLVQSNTEQWILWCGMNDESAALARAIPDSIEITGSDSPDSKIAAIEAFQRGEKRILVTKARIAGYGINLQNCHHMAFVGLGDSFENYYQCIRRCYRFGQQHPVHVSIIVSEIEQEVYANVLRKEQEANAMSEQLIEHVQSFERAEIGNVQQRDDYHPQTVKNDAYTLMLGDSCERMAEMADNSVDLSIFSPPFQSLYTYSPTERDLGNSRNADEFYRHFDYIIDHLLRVTKPGRNCCVHIQQIAASLVNDGFIGLKDFRGDVVHAFIERGFIYHGETTIDKNPQALKNGTPVLTPTGWVSIEMLMIGDEVIGSTGKATKVVGVWPQGQRPLYKVIFSDDTSVVCDGQHLWTVGTLGTRGYNSSPSTFKTMKTEDILANGLYTPLGRRRYEIPLVGEVEYAHSEKLPLDPYLVGALLGDGNISQRSTVTISTQTEVAEKCLLPTGHTWRRLPNKDKGDDMATYNLHGTGVFHGQWPVNDVLLALRELGLQGMRAWEKRIPARYLRASIEDRKALLQGLLDTDGKIHKSGGIWFHTTSSQLAEDVMQLAQSLGGLVRHNVETRRTYTYKGSTFNGRPIHEIHIRLNGSWCPFRLSTKAQWFKETRPQPRREIVSIEPVETDECTCITVEAPDGLYVTEHFIVTHNSQAVRTKAKGLLFVQLRKDASWMRPGLADYILVFRKPGENAMPVHSTLTNDEWIQWAHPVWYDIKEGDTLNAVEGRDEKDERHVCPLQLGTIERCIRLWSSPGETILDPFTGIGSTGYMAIKFDRRFVGCELKPSYFQAAQKNLDRMLQQKKQATLFDGDTDGLAI